MTSLYTKAQVLMKQMKDFRAAMKSEKQDLEMEDEPDERNISLLRTQILDFDESISAFEETLRALA